MYCRSLIAVSVLSASAAVAQSGTSTRGPWTIERSPSRTGNSPSLIVATKALADVAGPTGAVRPSIAIRCENNVTSFSLFTGVETEPIGSSVRAIHFRAYSGRSIADRWSVSNNGLVLRAPHPKEMIAEISNASRLVIEFRPVNRAAVSAEFSVSGLGPMIPEIARTCGWSSSTDVRELPLNRHDRGVAGDTPQAPVNREQVYFEYQVQQRATPSADNAPPVYPPLMRTANVEGTVLAQFVVDTSGSPELRTFKVLKSTHELFTQAVKTALPDWKFTPAEADGRKVRQLVQMPFQFSLSRSPDDERR